MKETSPVQLANVLREAADLIEHGGKPFPFHGGCLDCSGFAQHGRSYCRRCQYYEPNWLLPDFSTAPGNQLEDQE